ncbi:MAG: PAS domain S-box protein [Rhodothermaceae bacterium]
MNRSDSNNLSDIRFSDNPLFQIIPLGILIIDKNGEICFVNDNFYRFNVLNQLYTDLIGEDLFRIDLFKHVDISAELEKLKRGISFEKQIDNITVLDGSEISIILKGVSDFSGGSFNGGIILLEDIKFEKNQKSKLLFDAGYFSNIFSGLSEYFVITDVDGVIRFVPEASSDEKAKIIWEKNSLLAESFPESIKKEIFNSVDELKKNKETIFKELSVIINGQEYVLKLKFIPLLNYADVLEYIGVLLDIDSENVEGREKVEKELAELRQYQEITSKIVDAVINVNTEGEIVFWNDAASKLFLKSKSEVFGKFIGKVIDSLDTTTFENIKKDLIENEIWESELKFNKADTITEEHILIKMGYVRGGDSAIVILCSNISERKKIESELRKSEEKFRNIITNSNEGICTISKDGFIEYANPAFRKITDFSSNELKELKFIDLIDSEYKKLNNINSLEDCSISENEFPLVNKNGKPLYFLVNISSVNDFNNDILHYNAILTDITAKKKAEKDLLLTRSVFEASQDGIAIIVNRKIILANDSFAKIFGYDSVIEILNLDPLDFVANKDIAKFARYIQELEKDGSAPDIFSYTGKKKSGEGFFAEASVNSYTSEEKKHIVILFRDITEQKKAAQALKDSEEKYRSITENINEFMWTAERINGRLQTVFVTHAVKNITGYNAQKFIDEPFSWFRITHPNDMSAVFAKMKRLFRSDAKNYDCLEYRILTSERNTVWIQNKITVKRNLEGEIIKTYGIVSDITVAKKAEENFKKSAQNLKELNETKDRFISIISHDLRTPFSSILGFTDLLLDDPEMEQERQIEYVQFIRESSQNMLALVNSLLDWTRLQTGRISFTPGKLNAKTLAGKTIQMIKGAAIQKNINLTENISDGMIIHADEGLLMQVLNNLISNAVKFTNSGGSITISAEPKATEKKIVFTVKDSGTGIKPENIDKLFNIDSKFTLAGTSGEKGSGLGLSLCKEIIEKHGGKIWVESDYGNGSEFKFTIPVSSSNVLLVDDVTTDRLLYVKLLKSIIPDYNIIQAENGREALDEIEINQPVLVITDHNMPEMSGYDFVKHLSLKEGYKPQVIVLSSDVNESISEDYLELGIEHVFTKPVNISALKAAIDKSLKSALFK